MVVSVTEFPSSEVILVLPKKGNAVESIRTRDSGVDSLKTTRDLARVIIGNYCYAIKYSSE